MPRVKCPRCATIVEFPPGAKPVCPSCGYGAPAPSRRPAAPIAPRNEISSSTLPSPPGPEAPPWKKWWMAPGWIPAGRAEAATAIVERLKANGFKARKLIGKQVRVSRGASSMLIRTRVPKGSGQLAVRYLAAAPAWAGPLGALVLVITLAFTTGSRLRLKADVHAALMT